MPNPPGDNTGSALAVQGPADGARQRAKRFLDGIKVKNRFWAGSDIDLAVAGLPKLELFPAMVKAGMMSRFHIDIKRLEELDDHFKARALSSGKEI